MSSRFRVVAAAASTLVLAVSLSACGSDSSQPRAGAEEELSSTPSAQVSSAPASGAKVIVITLHGGTVDPGGDQVKVKRNQPVVLQITADEAGELHVHSTPEKHIDFPAGGSEITLRFDQPGLVDVEDHKLDKLIVKLEVS